MTAKVPARPLSVYVGDETRPEGVGTCTCPPGTVYSDCVCDWGSLVSRMIVMGYGGTADAAYQVRRLPALHADASRLSITARRTAFARLCASWSGTKLQLAELFGLSLKTVKEIDPVAWRQLSARVGYNSKNV